MGRLICLALLEGCGGDLATRDWPPFWIPVEAGQVQLARRGDGLVVAYQAFLCREGLHGSLGWFLKKGQHLRLLVWVTRRQADGGRGKGRDELLDFFLAYRHLYVAIVEKFEENGHSDG